MLAHGANIHIRNLKESAMIRLMCAIRGPFVPPPFTYLQTQCYDDDPI